MGSDIACEKVVLIKLDVPSLVVTRFVVTRFIGSMPYWVNFVISTP